MHLFGHNRDHDYYFELPRSRACEFAEPPRFHLGSGGQYPRGSSRAGIVRLGVLLLVRPTLP
jgi:hypothetical protein